MDFYKKTLAAMLVVGLLCAISGCTKKATDYDGFSEIMEEAEINQYEQIVSDFQEVSIDAVSNTVPASENENMYFYFGRLSCLYCREFVIKHKELLKDRRNFYYVDTGKMSDDEKEILKTFNINEVPAILRIDWDNNITLMEIDKFVEELENEV